MCRMVYRWAEEAAEARLAWQHWRGSRSRAGGTWCARPKSFGFYLEWNADPLKDLKQGCEKSGVCFRNPILLVLGIWCDKGPGGEQGAQRRNSYRNSGDRGMFTQQPWSTCSMVIPGLCAGDPTWTWADRSLVLRELVVTMERVGRVERCKWGGSTRRIWWLIRRWRWVRGWSFWLG